jgi:hypothetical protein
LSILVVPIALVGLGGRASAEPVSSEHFVITFTDVTRDSTCSPAPCGPLVGTVNATGPVAGLGVDTQSSIRSINPLQFSGDRLSCPPFVGNDRTDDQLTFALGALTLRLTAIDSSRTCDLFHCVVRDQQTGTFTVTDGTGAYAHARGHGFLTVTSTYVSAFPGGCDFRFRRFGTVVIDATGDVHV